MRKMATEMERIRLALEKTSVNGLEEIKFRIRKNDAFQPLLIRHANSLITCNLCEARSMNKTSLKQHLEGKKHIGNLSRIIEISQKNGQGQMSDISGSLNAMFRKVIHTLNVENLFLTEFKYINTDWAKMFVAIHGSYKCQMCNIKFAQNENELRKHLSTNKHKTNLELTNKLHHPTLSAVKDISTASKTTQEAINSQKTIENEKKISNDIINNLKKNIGEITKDKLLLIDYKTNNSLWRKMVIEIKGNLKCKLCNSEEYSNLQNLRQHLTQESHLNQMNSITEINNYTLIPTKEDINVKEAGEHSKTEEIGIKDSNPEQMSHIQAIWEKIAKSVDELGSENLKLIQYSVDNSTELFYMINETNLNDGRVLCICDLCKKNCLKLHDLKAHLKSKKHLANILKVTDIYHPMLGSRVSSVKPAENLTKKIQNPPNPEIEIINIDDDDEENEENKNNNIRINPAAVVANMAKEKNLNNSITTQKPIIVQLETIATNEKIITASARDINVRTTSGNTPNKQPKTPHFSERKITENLTKEVEGLIGVEYVVKILKYANDTSPRYECSLCEIELDGHGMEWHLKSLKHREKFLMRHFPTCMREFEKFRHDTDARPILAQITQHLAKAIEKYHGRQLPYECLLSEYQINRFNIMAKVYSFLHASEFTGPSFTNVVNRDLVEQYIARKHNYKEPVPDNKRQISFDNIFSPMTKRHRQKSPTLGVEEHKILVDKFIQQTLQRSRSRSRSLNRRNHNRSRSRSNNFSHFRRSRSFSPNRNNDHQSSYWRKYKKLCDDGLRDLENDLKRFKKFPESHPLYEREWKTFWERKCDEIEADGRDCANYDFQTEWIAYWPRRMEEINEEDFERLKIGLRRRLKLPTTNSPLPEFRYHIKSDKNDNSSTRNTKPTNANKMFGNNYGQIPYPGSGTNMQLSAPIQGPSTNQMGTQMMNTGMGQNVFSNMSYGVMGSNMANVPMPNVSMPQNPMYYPYTGNLFTNLQYSGNTYTQNPMNMQSNINFSNSNRTINNPSNINYNNPARQIKAVKQQGDVNTQNLQAVKRNVARNEVVDVFRNPSPEPKDNHSKNPAITQKISAKKSDDHIDTGPLNAVSVLRLLTALEDHLGSLGPKVVDLLAKALTLEKVKSNSADEHLLTTENCVFLETVREKLKGQLLAGVLDNSKIRPAKQAIRDINSLLENKNDIIEESIPEAPKPPSFSLDDKKKTSKTIELNNQNFKKRELTTKLAAALAMQGKTDFTSEQLEELVSVYLVIEKKQRENNSSNNEQKKNLSDMLLDFLKAPSIASKEGIPLNTAKNNITENVSFQDSPNSNWNSRSESEIQGRRPATIGNQYTVTNQNQRNVTSQVTQRNNILNTQQNYPHSSRLSTFDTSLNISNTSSNFPMSQQQKNSRPQIWQNQSNTQTNKLPSLMSLPVGKTHMYENSGNSHTGSRNNQSNPVFTSTSQNYSSQNYSSTSMITYPNNIKRQHQQQQQNRNFDENNSSIFIQNQNNTPLGWQQQTANRGKTDKGFHFGGNR